MKKFRFGVGFIDSYLNDLPEAGVYLFTESKTNIRHSFFHHFLSYHLSLDYSCLFVTGFSLAYENEIARKKLLTLNKYDNLTILETPSYLRQLINNSADLYKVINDLKLYIEALNPTVILIENIELLLSENNISLDSNLISLIVEFTNKRKVSVLMDISTLNEKNKMICQSFANALFKYVKSGKNDNYQLIVEKGKNLQKKQSITFTLDSDWTIIPPNARNTNFFTLYECKHLVMPQDSHEYAVMFAEIFKRDVPILYYGTIDDLESMDIDKKHSIIFIPAWTQSINGWQALPFIRQKFPYVKIIFSGSIHTPAYQKIRAIKMGADRFVEYPFVQEKVSYVMSELYEIEEKDRFKFSQHQISYVNDDLLNKYANMTIINDSLFRFIKEYAYNALLEGMSMSLFKFYMYKDITEVLGNFVCLNPKLIFISSYFVEEKPSVLMIYHNLAEPDTKQICTQLSALLANLEDYKYDTSETDDDPSNDKEYSSKNNLNSMVRSINYPLDEADLDYIFDWISEYV
ncbi:MAG: hypothetical protein FWG20_01180 [Candidatus Cloacimonetes bacterium]|nr:hypothetical protein [Candidatus Cloacimonadota bacterium]